MKKVIMIFVLLVTMSSLSYGEINYVCTYSETPFALRGEWVTIESSLDGGNSWLKREDTLLNVSKKTMRSAGRTYKIVKIEQYEEGGHILCVFKTDDPSKDFTLEFKHMEDSIILFQVFSDRKELFRSFIEIRK